MRQFRSLVGKWLRRLFERNGFLLIRPSMRFGIDPFVDIKTLSEIWDYSIDVFFDVGANDGETALKALREFRDARVFSFEPHPSTFAALVAKLGNCSNFVAINCALGRISAPEVEMFEYGVSRLNSMVDNAPYAVRFGHEPCRISVRCTTIDSFCSDNAISRIDVLKIDTEGFDIVVLEGALSMIKYCAIRFIYVEFNDLQVKEGTFGGALVPIDNLLNPYGYRFVASYNDNIFTEGEMFSVSNALFALPPSVRCAKSPAHAAALAHPTAVLNETNGRQSDA
jgi:FkbM family methyltransferase